MFNERSRRIKGYNANIFENCTFIIVVIHDFTYNSYITLSMHFHLFCFITLSWKENNLKGLQPHKYPFPLKIRQCPSQLDLTEVTIYTLNTITCACTLSHVASTDLACTVHSYGKRKINNNSFCIFVWFLCTRLKRK